MNQEEQAKLLAEWLAHPGESPPDALDTDVVEAMISLRPELAAPPRVSVDDILAGVTTGPVLLERSGDTGSFTASGSAITLAGRLPFPRSNPRLNPGERSTHQPIPVETKIVAYMCGQSVVQKKQKI